MIGSARGARLFPLLKRSQQVEGLTAVGLTSDGMPVVRLVRDKTRRPQLALCELVTCDDADWHRSLTQTVKRHKLSGAECTTVLDPKDYSLLLVEAPEVEATELKAALRWRIKDLIDFHIDDAVIDVFDVPSEGAQRRSRMMYVVAAKAAVVQARADVIHDTGLELAAIDIAELALRNVAALLPEDVNGVALVDIGPDRSQIVLTQQGNLYLARSVDIGSRQLRAGNLEEATGVLDGIVLEIQRSLDYYESSFSQAPIRNLVLGPAAQDLPSVIDYLGKNLAVSVKVLDLNELLEAESKLDAATQARCLPVIGAALRTERAAL